MGIQGISPDVYDLFGVLQERGYMPQETEPGAPDWFDLDTAGGKVRVVVDDGDWIVYVFDHAGVNLYGVRFSPGSPLSAVIPVLDAAEGK